MGRLYFYLFFALLLFAGAGPAEAQLKTALEVRSLPAEDAESGLAVDLRGVVIFHDGTVFLQDETAGTFFQWQGDTPPRPGDEIRVRGVSFPGLYLPGIKEATFEVLSHPGLPVAVPADYDDLISGRYHYQRVVVEGIVRTSAEDESGSGVIRLALGSRVVEVRFQETPEEVESLVDCRVRITGLAAGELNQRRQLVEPYLRCRDSKEVEVLERARDRSAIPEVSPEQLLNFAVGGQELHRVKVTGTVLAEFTGGELYLRCGETGIGIRRLPSEHQLSVGDTVEMIGFPEMDRFSARLVDALVTDHFLGEEAPEPIGITIDELHNGGSDGDLVSVEGEISDQYRGQTGGVLVVREGDQTVRVDVPEKVNVLSVGTRVRATGIARVESTRRSSAYRTDPDRVSLKMRSHDDLVVTRAPSWWTAKRLLTALIVLFVATVLGALWIALLQRQVTRQTAVIRHRIEHEAALEERHRIAREFHDTLEQDLAGLSLRLDAASTRGSDEKLRGFIEGSRNLVSRIQVETRNLVSDLRQEPGDEVDLAAALGELADRYAALPGPEVILDLSGESLPRLPARTLHHLRMIAQESITNIVKHAGATKVVVTVRRKEDRLLLKISDDGCGFDADSETSGKSGHFGCVGMRERCRKIGATITWHSEAGRGTEVLVSVPLNEEDWRCK